MTTKRSRLRHYPMIAAVMVMLAISVQPSSAGADTQSELDEIRRQRAAAASQVDTLRATDAEVGAALDALEANVAAEASALREAERKATEAETMLDLASAEVEAKEAEIEELQAEAKEVAIAAYMQPQSSGGLVESLSSESIGEAELKHSLLRAQSASQSDVLDQLERAHEDLEAARAAAASASETAAEHRSSVESRLTSVSAARDQQATVASDVQARLDRQLSEAEALADQDAELSAKLKAEQEELARKLAAQQAAARAQRPSGPVTVNVVGEGSIVSVRGIRVHQSIADNLAAMLSAAEADGVVLGGGGYRSPQAQISVRQRNCGTSNYAIYQMPASQCRPPTAPPGASMHERGLAVDFTVGCCTIKSRSSAAFQWLAANAANYGFYNLPSEPWHWSVNGR